MTRIPLLLLPGTCNDERLWAHQKQALAEMTVCYVADLTQHNNITDMAETGVAAMPPGPFALAGFSLGGYVALEIMRQSAPRVLGLALINSSARPEPDAAKPGRAKMMEMARADFSALVARLLGYMLPTSRQQDHNLVDEIRIMMEEVGPEAFVRQSQAVINRKDSRALLPTITCPTVIISSSDDLVAPARCGEEMANAIPGAMLHVLTDTGHLAPMEQPDIVTRHLQHWIRQFV